MTVLVSNRIECWSNYLIRFKISNIRTALVFLPVICTGELTVTDGDLYATGDTTVEQFHHLTVKRRSTTSSRPPGQPAADESRDSRTSPQKPAAGKTQFSSFALLRRTAQHDMIFSFLTCMLLILISLTHSLVDHHRWRLATADDYSIVFLLHCSLSCDISFSWM